MSTEVLWNDLCSPNAWPSSDPDTPRHDDWLTDSVYPQLGSRVVPRIYVLALLMSTRGQCFPLTIMAVWDKQIDREGRFRGEGGSEIDDET